MTADNSIRKNNVYLHFRVLYVPVLLLTAAIGIILILSFLNIYPLKAAIFVIIIFTSLIVFMLTFINKNKKYKFVKTVSIEDDRIVYETYGKIKFVAFYEDFGLIINTIGYGTPPYITYVPHPVTDIVYYNRDHKRCFHIIIDSRWGNKIIKRYKKYCREKGLRCCPIIENIVENYEIERQAVGKLMESSFCKRKNIKYDSYEMYGRIPPPPWLEGGNEDGGQVQ